MTRYARCKEYQGEILRSGTATGADSAFEAGVSDQANKVIFLPWSGFNNRTINSSIFDTSSYTHKILREIDDILIDIHPNFSKLSKGALALHRRNVMQILRSGLTEPAKKVVFWAKEDYTGEVSGGTRTAVMLARSLGIRTLNLYEEDCKQGLVSYLLRNNY